MTSTGGTVAVAADTTNCIVDSHLDWMTCIVAATNTLPKNNFTTNTLASTVKSSSSFHRSQLSRNHRHLAFATAVCNFGFIRNLGNSGSDTPGFGRNPSHSNLGFGNFDRSSDHIPDFDHSLGVGFNHTISRNLGCTAGLANNTGPDPSRSSSWSIVIVLSFCLG